MTIKWYHIFYNIMHYIIINSYYLDKGEKKNTLISTFGSENSIVYIENRSSWVI